MNVSLTLENIVLTPDCILGDLKYTDSSKGRFLNATLLTKVQAGSETVFNAMQFQKAFGPRYYTKGNETLDSC